MGEFMIAYITKITKWRKLYQVSKVDAKGQRVQVFYNCTECYITGLLILGKDVFIIHYNGTVLQFSIKDGTFIQIYYIDFNGSINHRIIHTGSLSSNPSMIPDHDLLLLADTNQNTVFTYRLSTRKKIIRLRNINANPKSVSYMFCNNSAVFYILCVTNGGEKGNVIVIYDSEWTFVRSFSGLGTSDGKLQSPQAAIVSPDNTIIVADYHNNRLSEFTMEGLFVRQILDSDDGITKPEALSFWFPNLWVIHSGGKLYGYKYL